MRAALLIVLTLTPLTNATAQVRQPQGQEVDGRRGRWDRLGRRLHIWLPSVWPNISSPKMRQAGTRWSHIRCARSRSWSHCGRKRQSGYLGRSPQSPTPRELWAAA